MRLHSYGLEVLIALGSLLLGVLFLQSVAVDPGGHHSFDTRLAQLSALDARLEAHVLRARQGLLSHYDAIVEDLAALAHARESVRRPPAHLGDEARHAFLEDFARYEAAVREKETLAERFKSENAALRNSLVYLPIAARDLERSGADPGAVRAVQAEMLAYLSGAADVRVDRVRAAVDRLDALSQPGADARVAALVEATVIHARNVLDRTSVLDRTVQEIVENPSRQLAAELHAGYRQGTAIVEARAHRFRLILYLCAAAMIASVAYFLSALSRTKRELESANATLDRRVRERTEALSLANGRLERHSSELQGLNDELEENQVELERSRKQQLELRDRFLSHVSHELRTPLASLHQFLSLLHDGIGGDLNGEQREFVALGLKNADQLEAMIADLMEVTRAESGKLRIDPQPMDLAGLVEEVRRSFVGKAEARGIGLHAHVQANLGQVFADATRVRQVLNNLVENALKFTPDQGEISIACGADPEAPDRVRVTVADSGCGIAEDQLEQVFDRLHQVSGRDGTSRTGLGLGLAIAQELVQRQDGRIWVDSRVGEGSRFHFQLPFFSIEEVLRPALLREGRLRESFCLVRVALDGTLGEGDGARGALRWLRGGLNGLCYYPSDVVLPQHDGNTLFLVASTDAFGMRVLLDRMRGHFSERPVGQPAGVEVQIAGHAGSIPADERELPVAEGLCRAARRIERLIDDATAWAA